MKVRPILGVKSSRLKSLRRQLLDAPYELCTQKSYWITDYFKSNTHLFQKKSVIRDIVEKVHYRSYKKSLFSLAKGQELDQKKIAINHKLGQFYAKNYHEHLTSSLQVTYAKALAHTLENMELKVYPDELIVGNCSSKRIGAPVHTDLSGVLLVPELADLTTRKVNPIEMSSQQKEQLEDEIFPFWFNKSVLFHTSQTFDDPALLNDMLSGGYFILTQIAGISHLTPNYQKVIEVGFLGIKQEIKTEIEKLKKLEQSDENVTKLQFLKSLVISTDAAIDYGVRWSKKLSELAMVEKDEKRKKELCELAEMFKTIPAKPAESFHQALQSMMITHVIVHQESFQHGVSFGRLDQFLYSYYKKDIESGKIDDEKVVELIGCFLGKAAELLPLFFERATEYFSGLSSASGITLGGSTPDSDDAVNELSYLILSAYDQMRLRQPNIHVRVNENTSRDFLNYSFEILKKGGGIPAFFNDPKIITSLINQNYSSEDAHAYSVVGCSEWGVPSKSFPAAGAGFINLAFALNMTLGTYRGDFLQDRRGNKISDSTKSIEDVLQLFELNLKELLDVAVTGNNCIESVHANYRPTPFLSAIVEGPIQKAKDLNAGGSIYNSSGFQAVGLADVANSLMAIQQVVFTQKKLTLSEFVAVIDSNFKDYDSLRSYILNRVPKYGQDNLEVDQFSQKVSEIYSRLVSELTHQRGGRYLPGFWTMTTHQGFGKRTAALPSGRLHGECLSNGISPTLGSEKYGPTAALNSASNVDSDLAGNGMILNQKVDKQNISGERGNVILEGLLRGHFNGGGIQVQFNILDQDTLLKARKNPDLYKDLVVRISGYSAYFNDLTEDMKDELILRNTHHV